MQRFIDNFSYATTAEGTGSVHPSAVLPPEAVALLEALLPEQTDWCEVTLWQVGSPIRRVTRTHLGLRIGLGFEEPVPAGTVIEACYTARAAALAAPGGREITEVHAGTEELVITERIGYYSWAPNERDPELPLLISMAQPPGGTPQALHIVIEIANPIPESRMRLQFHGLGSGLMKIPLGTGRTDADEDDYMELSLPLSPYYRITIEGMQVLTLVIDRFDGYDTFE